MARVMVDRRRLPRIDTPVCSWLTFSREHAIYATLSVDLGEEGACFCTHHPVRKGEEIAIQMDLESSRIECSGMVCWTKPGGSDDQYFGVRFNGVERGARRQIADYLSDIEEEPAAATR